MLLALIVNVGLAGAAVWFLARLWATFFGTWKVKGRTNATGSIVYLRKGFRKVEAGRVKQDRESSAHPANDFNEQFGVVMARARNRADSLNSVERNWSNGRTKKSPKVGAADRDRKDVDVSTGRCTAGAGVDPEARRGGASAGRRLSAR